LSVDGEQIGQRETGQSESSGAEEPTTIETGLPLEFGTAGVGW
jgi:hypothetical protein